MVKVASSDIIAILRRFEVANDEHKPRHIERMSFHNTTPLNTVVDFRFLKRHFYLLFDNDAHDDPAYIMNQIQQIDEISQGETLPNVTSQPGEYALEYRDNDVYVFAVTPLKRRLDSELSLRYPDTSRSTWQKHIKAGHITVNGIIQMSPKFDITDSDAISIELPEATDYSNESLPIIYMDDDVIVINKPIGILSHAKGALHDEFSVADFFRRYSTYNLDTNRPGIVHRLDRDTSGIMIGARHADAARLLQEQFADRRAKKTYIAVLDGKLKNSAARIELPIERHPLKPSTFRVGASGKDAITSYTVLSENSTETLVQLRPRTGRTHQLRVHMAHLGTPIHGDRVYGRASDRLYLHAESLEVTLPGGKRHTFTTPTPDTFAQRFQKDS